MRSFIFSFVLVSTAACSANESADVSSESSNCESGFDLESGTATHTSAMPQILETSGLGGAINPGDDVTLGFSVGSRDQCASYSINAFLFQINGKDDWEEARPDATSPSLLRNLTTDESMAQADVDGNGDDTLVYIWNDDTVAQNDAAPMETQYVDAEDQMFYEFTWTASSIVRSGDLFPVWLKAIDWTDEDTGQHIRFWWPSSARHYDEVNYHVFVL